jgi:hypothetical protein
MAKDRTATATKQASNDHEHPEWSDRIAGPELEMTNEETKELQNRGNFLFPPHAFSGASAPSDCGKRLLPIDILCILMLNKQIIVNFSIRSIWASH